MEFNRTCYITSPHGTGVREQHFFRCVVVRPSVRHCLLLNHWAKFNQTCYMTSPHGKGLREQHYFSVSLCIHCLSICLSHHLLLNHHHHHHHHHHIHFKASFPLPRVGLVWQVFLWDALSTQNGSGDQQSPFPASFCCPSTLHPTFSLASGSLLCNYI